MSIVIYLSVTGRNEGYPDIILFGLVAEGRSMGCGIPAEPA
jgi:hypothetical protein